MAIIESINVKVNDYLLLSSYPRPKDPPMISPIEEGDILSIPKEALTSYCGDSCLVSKDARITLGTKHPVIEGVRMKKGTQ